MFYPQELLPRPRPRARPPINGSYIQHAGRLQPFGSQDESRSKPHSCCKQVMMPYLKEYCAVSSVHGIRYLAEPKLPRMINYHFRFIWLLILIGTFICATIVYVDLSALYNSERVQTTIENTMQPIFFVPFPSVAFCLRSRLSMYTLENEVTDVVLGINASQAKRELFQHFILSVSDIHFNDMSSLSKFFANESLVANISQLDGIDVTQILEHTNLKCSEIFVDCSWRNKAYNCCDIFELQRTEMGFCWVFNSQVSAKTRRLAKEDKYYPRRLSQNGPGSALQVHLSRNKTFIRTNGRGVHVMIKQPQQWSDSARLLSVNTNNKISLNPRFTSTDMRTRSLSPKDRRCIFPDEIKDPNYKNLPGFVYWRGNCRSRCHQEHVVKLCNCSPSMLFPVSKEDNFTVCKASDFKCIYDHRMTFGVERLALETEYVDDVYEDTMTCDCLNSCNQLIYDTIHSSTAMGENELDLDAYSMHVDIFFQSPWFIKYQTHMRFTFVELLASFGGIIGLFLGASLLSAIELVYFFTIGLYLYIFHGNRKSKKQEIPEAPLTLHFRHKITPTKTYY
ncbi:hypothetical protein KR093_007786 [Drosophila rubida]|uniref:Pickpocket protein 19 n=1 Tax=Drosophila rubida TaxID=30044 RepID=A0AAD4JU01_9MUSC|nr:hypothetical protein KR093_007786 [Drosophila rubida]